MLTRETVVAFDHTVSQEHRDAQRARPEVPVEWVHAERTESIATLRERDGRLIDPRAAWRSETTPSNGTRELIREQRDAPSSRLHDDNDAVDQSSATLRDCDWWSN
jgi:hypothetical protein